MTQHDREVNRLIIIGLTPSDQDGYYTEIKFWNPSYTGEIVFLYNDSNAGLYFRRLYIGNPTETPNIIEDGILGSVLIKRFLGSTNSRRGDLGNEWERYKTLKLKNPETGQIYIIQRTIRQGNVFSITPDHEFPPDPYKLSSKRKNKYFNDDDYLEPNLEDRKKKLSKPKNNMKRKKIIRKIKVVKKCKCK